MRANAGGDDGSSEWAEDGSGPESLRGTTGPTREPRAREGQGDGVGDDGRVVSAGRRRHGGAGQLRRRANREGAGATSLEPGVTACQHGMTGRVGRCRAIWRPAGQCGTTGGGIGATGTVSDHTSRAGATVEVDDGIRGPAHGSGATGVCLPGDDGHEHIVGTAATAGGSCCPKGTTGATCWRVGAATGRRHVNTGRRVESAGRGRRGGDLRERRDVLTVRSAVTEQARRVEDPFRCE